MLALPMQDGHGSPVPLHPDFVRSGEEGQT